MADESVGQNTTKRGTNLIKRMGQTASRYYGNDPSTKFGKVGSDARDLKP